MSASQHMWGPTWNIFRKLHQNLNLTGCHFCQQEEVFLCTVLVLQLEVNESKQQWQRSDQLNKDSAAGFTSGLLRVCASSECALLVARCGRYNMTGCWVMLRMIYQFLGHILRDLMSVVSFYNNLYERLLLFGDFHFLLDTNRKHIIKRWHILCHSLYDRIKTVNVHRQGGDWDHLWQPGGWGDLLVVCVVRALRLVSGRLSRGGLGVLSQPFRFTLDLRQQACQRWWRLHYVC